MVLVCIAVSIPALAQSQDPKRDRLIPKALLKGHWLTESGRTHYYFDGDDQLVMVGDGKTVRMKYEILSESKGDHSLEVKVDTGKGGHTKVIRFATSGTSALESVTITFDGKKISVHTMWKYVDGKTEPVK
jgi:hypothetical protein